MASDVASLLAAVDAPASPASPAADNTAPVSPPTAAPAVESAHALGDTDAHTLGELKQQLRAAKILFRQLQSDRKIPEKITPGHFAGALPAEPAQTRHTEPLDTPLCGPEVALSEAREHNTAADLASAAASPGSAPTDWGQVGGSRQSQCYLCP